MSFSRSVTIFSLSISLHRPSENEIHKTATIFYPYSDRHELISSKPVLLYLRYGMLLFKSVNCTLHIITCLRYPGVSHHFPTTKTRPHTPVPTGKYSLDRTHRTGFFVVDTQPRADVLNYRISRKRIMVFLRGKHTRLNPLLSIFQLSFLPRLMHHFSLCNITANMIVMHNS